MSECRIRKKRSRIAAWGITFLLPLLLVFYSWFMEHRPRLHDSKEWNLQDTLIQNSDLLMAAVFLVLSLLPFYLMFDRRWPPCVWWGGRHFPLCRCQILSQ